MIKNLVLILTTSFVSSINVLASTSVSWYPAANITLKAEISSVPLKCPNIERHESEMIAKFQLLKSKIKETVQCKAVSDGIQNLEHLAGERRTEFFSLIDKTRAGNVLSDSENAKLVSYVEDITAKATTLASSLTASTQCIDPVERSQYLLAISSLVNEGSTLLSSIGGPWGLALGVGGKLISGLMNGIGQYIQSVPNFNFNDAKDWQGYVETLCFFHDQQDEISALIYPEQAIANLENIQTKIEIKLNSILQRYSEGLNLKNAFRSQNGFNLQRLSEKIDSYNQEREGLKSVRLLSAQQWVSRRLKIVRMETNDPWYNSSGRHLIHKSRSEIEDFLFEDQGPKFLAFQLKVAGKQAQEFESMIHRSGYAIYRQIEEYNSRFIPQNRNFAAPSEKLVIETLMKIDLKPFLDSKSEEGDQIVAMIRYFRRTTLNQWDSLNLAYSVKHSFCKFFQLGGYYSLEMQSVCISRNASKIEEFISYYGSIGNALPASLYRKKFSSFSGGLDWQESLKNWVELQ